MVTNESNKIHLAGSVDTDNEEDLFRCFTSLSLKVSSFVREIKSGYLFSGILMGTILEFLHQQVFFAQRLPALTDVEGNSTDFHKQNGEFLIDLLLNKRIRG